MPEQYQILPEERYRPHLEEIFLDTIAGETLMPEASFIESVRALGVIQPIAVIKAGTGYRLVAGRRRLTAMKEVTEQGEWGRTTIPALVFPSDTPISVASAMALSENVQRRANPLTDLESIEALVQGGASLEGISRQLHLPLGTIRSRMRLGSLVPELREGLRNGQMAASTAERAARLDTMRQLRLAVIMVSEGRLTAGAVTESLRAGQAEQLDAIDPTQLSGSWRPFDTWEVSNPMPVGAPNGYTMTPVRRPRRTRTVVADGDGTPLVVARSSSPRPTEEDALIARVQAQATPMTVAAPVPLPTLDAMGLPTEHSWNGVLRCIQRAEELLPMASHADDERIAEWLGDLQILVRGRIR